MRRTKSLRGTVCAIVLFPVVAWAQAGTGYVRFGVGPAFTDTTELEQFALEPVPGAELHFDTGIGLNVSGGFRFTDWFAVELQGGLIYNEVRSVGLPSSGDLRVARYPLLANVVFEIPTATPLVPYFGAGLGGAVSVLDADHFTIGTTTADGAFSDFVFAYQAFAGLRYEISPSMALVAGYHFFHSDPTRWEPDVTFGTSGDIQSDRIRTHLVTLGLSFSF